jgi:hypothetical protein
MKSRDWEQRFMVKRILIFVGLSVALLAAPKLFADQGDHGNHGKHGNKHDDEGWERKDGYEYRVYQRDERPPGWVTGKERAGAIAACRPDKPRSTAVKHTSIRDGNITIARMTKDESWCGVPSSTSREA